MESLDDFVRPLEAAALVRATQAMDTIVRVKDGDVEWISCTPPKTLNVMDMLDRRVKDTFGVFAMTRCYRRPEVLSRTILSRTKYMVTTPVNALPAATARYFRDSWSMLDRSRENILRIKGGSQCKDGVHGLRFSLPG